MAWSGKGTLWPENTTAKPPPSQISRPSVRFMAGDPMKVATNRLTGASNSFWGRVGLLQLPILEHRHPVPRVIASI